VISAVVEGERDVAVRLDTLPDLLHRRLLERFVPLAERMAADERARAPERTGKLRSEIKGRVQEAPDLVRAQVRVEATGPGDHVKAAALEYGAHGTAAVRSFERHGHTPYGAAAEQIVEAYSRRVNIIERRFARGALDDFRDAAKSAVEEAARGL